MSVSVAIMLLVTGFLATLLVASRSVNRIDEVNQGAFEVDSQEALNKFRTAIELEVREFELDLIYLEATHPSAEPQFQQFFGAVGSSGLGGSFPYIFVESVDGVEFEALVGREDAINPGKVLEPLQVGPDQSIVVTRSTVPVDIAIESIRSDLDGLMENLNSTETGRIVFWELPPAAVQEDVVSSAPMGYLVGSAQQMDGSVIGYLIKPISVGDILGPISGSSFGRINASVQGEAQQGEVFALSNDMDASLEEAHYVATSSVEVGGLEWEVTTWNNSGIDVPPSVLAPSFEWLTGASGTISLTLAWLMWSARDRRVNDVTKEVLIAQELAFTDGLTGLLNREGLLDAAKRLGTVRATLFFIDLNHFKAVNDTHGHEAGDRVLVAVAETLGETTRSFDKVARVGGDEFVVLMPGMADRRRAVRMARAIERRIEVMRTGVTASVGVASAESDQSLDMDELIKQADEEMYQRKQEYHNVRGKSAREEDVDSAPSWVVGER